MKTTPPEDMEELWARHDADWRDTAQVSSQWKEANEVDPELLKFRVSGNWWEVLHETGLTLIVTREYEHLVIAMRSTGGNPEISFMPLPHPSGMAVDKKRGVIHIASTRNPNQIFDFVPVTGALRRLDVEDSVFDAKPLVPARSRFFPGCLYMHDLAMIGGKLHGNAVGQNAVVRFHSEGGFTRVWWPNCIESEEGPVFGQNHIQLNSIAAGKDLESSYFSASTDRITTRRPGHRNFKVDRRGVVFSGRTRTPAVKGLTRPHSARLHKGKLWIDNSGYGGFGFANQGEYEDIVRLPGWTRGLFLQGNLGFVGTSRVIPRFRQYAPGLEVESSQCGLHAVNLQTGAVLGSVIWPRGNQIFGIEGVDAGFTTGFPFAAGRRAKVREKKLFYSFKTKMQGEEN